MSFDLTFSRPKCGMGSLYWDTRLYLWLLDIPKRNIVSWRAKKQPSISLSTCKSENRVMEKTTAQIIWITHLLQELHDLPAAWPTLSCDNKNGLFLTQNLVSHKRSTHIYIYYHFIRELVSFGNYTPSLFHPSFRWLTFLQWVFHDINLSSSEIWFTSVHHRFAWRGTLVTLNFIYCVQFIFLV